MHVYTHVLECNISFISQNVENGRSLSVFYIIWISVLASFLLNKTKHRNIFRKLCSCCKYCCKIGDIDIALLCCGFVCYILVRKFNIAAKEVKQHLC
jgi:hypothetical protein